MHTVSSSQKAGIYLNKRLYCDEMRGFSIQFVSQVTQQHLGVDDQFSSHLKAKMPQIEI